MIPYISEHNYISKPGTIAPLKDFDIFTHFEQFEVEYRSRKFPVKFAHKFRDDSGKMPNLYQEMVNNFINVNHRFIPDGSIVVDIGGYDGDTSILFGIMCGADRGGKVYTFEPSPSFASQLNINLGFNPALNIIPLPYAVMEKEGIHIFKYCATDDNGGCAATNELTGTYTVPRFVRAVNFLKFFERNPIDFNKLAMIKLDTEGHDFDILDSFKSTIKDYRWTLHCEWFPGTHQKIQNLLDYLDYKMYCGFSLEPLNVYSKWRQDIILVPSEKISRFSLK